MSKRVEWTSTLAKPAPPAELASPSPPTVANNSERFFTRLDWSAFWTAWAISFAVYFYTMAPTVTLEDSGELAVGGDFMGVPHPPGYPIWTFLVWFFSKVFIWVPFRGQPNPAWGITLGSVFFGSLSTGIMAMLICRSGSDILVQSKLIMENLNKKTEDMICWAAGVVSGLLLAFSPVMWSQCVIVEVYSLNALFMVLIFLLVYWWTCRPSNKLLYVTAYLFGLGLTNYQVLLLAAVPLIIIILLKDLDLFRDFAIMGICYLIGLVIVIQLAALPSMPGFARNDLILPDNPADFFMIMAQEKYYWISMAIAISVAVMSCIAIWVFKKGQRWPIVPSALLAVSGIALVMLPVMFGPVVPDRSAYHFTLMPPEKYFWIFLSASAVVVSCIAMWFLKKDQRWPIAPSALLAVSGIALVVLLANIEPAVWIPRQGEPSPQPFQWKLYYLGFAGAIAVLIALCSTFRKGFLPAIALVTITVTLAVMLRKGVLLGLVNPNSHWFHFYLCLNFVFLAVAAIMLPRGRAVAIMILMAQLGFAFYALMPIVSDLRNPPINWGYPRTWEGFLHALTRGQYEKISPADMFSPVFIQQLGSYFTDLREQFTLPVALLGFLPFTAWQIKILGRRINALYVAIALALPAAFLVLIEEAFGLENVTVLSAGYKIPTACIMLILAIGGVTMFVGQAREFVLKLSPRSRVSFSEKLIVALTLVGVIGGYLVYGTMLAIQFIDVIKPLRQAGQTITNEQLGAMFLHGGVLILLIVLPVLIAVIIAWLMHSKTELKMTIDENSHKWMISVLIGFLCMSIMLIVLANPKGDIQDAFIQRVKFISSHALYVFWIGYGLIFGLAFANILFKNNKMIKWLSVGTAMAFSLIPIHENLNNKELIRRSGGAELNGHDFGWQFGNYQLRGAEAITEELSPEEEPLPNPEFPPEMGQNAIFFGGTDPGRFVPTYMIYSARVREDVYLITQNALADSTYMSVMRDLYGDRIWIPATPDSAKAFQRYVEEVQAGKRPANADLKIENGRVQVSGALGVMEINGILAQMIFEHNNYRHPFYVEESYVIRWMYPYLTPHGLIMKINKDQCDLPAETVRDDTDFWDWYTRRMTSDTKFLRDVVARKSFSKLRSAIAGLYASRGRLPEAEKAYQQARMLYPLSPEANFRLAQEVLMPMNRITDARMLIEEFGRMDPGNNSVPDFVGRIRKLEDMLSRIAALEQQIPGGKLDINNAFELMDLYLQCGQMPKFMGLAMNMINDTNLPPVLHYRLAQSLARAGRLPEMARALDLCANKLPQPTPPEIYLELARMYGSARLYDKMVPYLQKYLQAKPDDWRAWLDMSLVNVSLGKTNDAIKTISEALRLGGPEALKICSEDARFAPFRGKIQAPRQMNLLEFPGMELH